MTGNRPFQVGPASDIYAFRPIDDEAALSVLGSLNTQAGGDFGSLSIKADYLPALSPSLRLSEQDFDQPVTRHRDLVRQARLVMDSMSGDQVPVPLTLYKLTAGGGCEITAHRFDGGLLPELLS